MSNDNNNYHPQDDMKLNYRVVTSREGNKITTTVDLFGGATRLNRMSDVVVDLQQDHLEEALNCLGYFHKDNPPEQ